MTSKTTPAPAFALGETLQPTDWRGMTHPCGRVMAYRWVTRGQQVVRMTYGGHGTIHRSGWAYQLSSSPTGGYWLEPCLRRVQLAHEPASMPWAEMRERLLAFGHRWLETVR